MTISEFRARGTDMSSPADDAVPIDVSGGDHTPESPYRALLVGGAGNVVVDTLRGVSRTIPVAANSILPVIIKKVYQTGTTATDIFGLE